MVDIIGVVGTGSDTDVIVGQSHADTQVEDVLIAFVHHATGNAAGDHIVRPTGFSLVSMVENTSGKTWTYVGVATTSGAQNYSFTHGTANNQACVMVTLRGVDTGAPVEDYDMFASWNVTVTTITPNALLLGLAGLDGSAAMTFTANMPTKVYEATFTNTYLGMAVFSEVASTPGDYNREADSSASGSVHWHLLAIRPADGTPPTVIPLAKETGGHILLESGLALLT